MTLTQENFAVELAASAKTHDQWIGIVNFGLRTLLEEPGLLAEIIVTEAIREAEKDPHIKPADKVASILKELGLRITIN